MQTNSYARRVVLAGAVILTTITGSLGVAFQPAGATTVTPTTGTISTYATLPTPTDNYYALTGDPSGNLYAVDSNTCTVIKIDASTQASTTISTNSSWCSSDDYNMTYAVLSGTPTLVIADYNNSAIYEVPASGGPVVQVGYEYAPAGVAYDAATDTLYIADYDSGNAHTLLNTTLRKSPRLGLAMPMGSTSKAARCMPRHITKPVCSQASQRRVKLGQ